MARIDRVSEAVGEEGKSSRRTSLPGGEITVASTVGGGNTFMFHLPVSYVVPRGPCYPKTRGFVQCCRRVLVVLNCVSPKEA